MSFSFWISDSITISLKHRRVEQITCFPSNILNFLHRKEVANAIKNISSIKGLMCEYKTQNLQNTPIILWVNPQNMHVALDYCGIVMLRCWLQSTENVTRNKRFVTRKMFREIWDKFKASSFGSKPRFKLDILRLE